MASNAFRPVRPCRTRAPFALNPTDRRGESRSLRSSSSRRRAVHHLTSLCGLLGSLLFLRRLLLGGFTFLCHRMLPPFLTKSYTLAAFCQRKSSGSNLEKRRRTVHRAFGARRVDGPQTVDATSWHRVHDSPTQRHRRTVRRRLRGRSATPPFSIAGHGVAPNVNSRSLRLRPRRLVAAWIGPLQKP
mgnify:CR=1 FL=1